MDWKEIYKEKIVTADEAMQHIQRGDLIIPGDFGAEPVYLMEHMTKRAGTLGNVKVMHGGNIGPEPHLLSESKEFVDFECLCAVRTLSPATSMDGPTSLRPSKSLMSR